jgi:hypothetical protein
MALDPAPSLAHLLDEIRREFPRFRLVRKDQSGFQRALHYTLVAITFGRMREYLDGYHTTIGQRIYVTPDWDDRSDLDRYVTLRHERVHLRQFRRFSLPLLALLYLFLPLPMGLAWFRARFEKEAYAETILATAEVWGRERARDPALRAHILRQFTGPTYGWMWPFRRNLETWYDSVLAKI